MPSSSIFHLEGTKTHLVLTLTPSELSACYDLPIILGVLLDNEKCYKYFDSQ